MRAAILRDGCVLVRGLIDRGRALALAAGIDAAYDRRERREAGEDPRDGYYDEFVPDGRFGQDLLRRLDQGRRRAAGGRLTEADVRVHRGAARRRLDRLVAEYLGEPALVSAHKTTMRKAQPSVSGQWHQDGKFMGEVRSLNLWLSLSRCGDVAPGLDIVPVRLDDYVATGTEGAALSWTISDDQARRRRGRDPDPAADVRARVTRCSSTSCSSTRRPRSRRCRTRGTRSRTGSSAPRGSPRSTRRSRSERPHYRSASWIPNRPYSPVWYPAAAVIEIGRLVERAPRSAHRRASGARSSQAASTIPASTIATSVTAGICQSQSSGACAK